MDNTFWDKFRLAIKEGMEYPEKISSRQAAMQIGISASTLSRIEKGKLPDADTFLKICDWINRNSKYDLSPYDFSEINTPSFIVGNFNNQEEELMYKTIESVSAAVRTLKFSGIFSIKDKDFFYIEVSEIPMRLIREVSRRLEKYGKWETHIISINNNPYPYNKNGICIRRNDFNTKNIIAKY